MCACGVAGYFGGCKKNGLAIGGDYQFTSKHFGRNLVGMITSSILTIGNELLDGRVLNTNQHYISVQLSELGFSVRESSTVNDDFEDIVDTIKRLAATSQLIIVTGGLGPTTDDITSECIAAAIGDPCVQFDAAVAHLKTWYEARNRQMPMSNLKQTRFPLSATLIPNALGTAMGAYVWFDGVLIVSLPGVPSEMKQMMVSFVVPLLELSFKVTRALFYKEYRCFGLSESEIQDRVLGLSIPDSVQISYRVPFPEVVIKLTSHESLGAIHVQLLDRLSPHVFSQEGETFLDWVARILKERKITVSLAESCTGGLLSSLLASVPGASAYLIEGRVTYSNEAKQRLGVLAETLDKYGAVSEPVVKEMAVCIKKLTAASIGVAVSGIAGPDGAMPGKPVGTVCFGFSFDGITITETTCFSGNRERIQHMSAYHALWVVMKNILGL